MISSSLRHMVHVLLVISKPLLRFYKCGSLVLTWLCKLRTSTPQWHKESPLPGKETHEGDCFWCSVATTSHHFYSWFRYLLLHDRISVIRRSIPRASYLVNCGMTELLIQTNGCLLFSNQVYTEPVNGDYCLCNWLACSVAVFPQSICSQENTLWRNVEHGGDFTERDRGHSRPCLQSRTAVSSKDTVQIFHNMTNNA